MTIQWNKIIPGFAIFFVVVSIAMYFNWLGGPRALNRETALFVGNWVTLLLVGLTYWRLARHEAATKTSAERKFESESSALIRPGLRSAPSASGIDESRRYNDDAP